MKYHVANNSPLCDVTANNLDREIVIVNGSWHRTGCFVSNFKSNLIFNRKTGHKLLFKQRDPSSDSENLPVVKRESKKEEEEHHILL